MTGQESTSLLNWNWASKHVQVELANGEYVSAESTLILGGPAKLDMLNEGTVTDSSSIQKSNSLYPIGVLQGLNVGQNRQVARLFEVGSKRAYFIPGRLYANFTANRILFYGPSLLRLLYSVAPTGRKYGGQPFTFVQEGGAPKPYNTLKTPTEYEKLVPKEGFSLIPGYGQGSGGTDNRDFFISLASELFNIPFGMCVVMKDARHRTYGAYYLEDCMVESHGIGYDANNVVIMEQVSGQFDMVRPIQTENLLVRLPA
jgi:hypothetical protein